MTGSDEIPGRLPPQNLEAEQCVLGSMLLDRECIGEVLLVIEAEDFYMPANATVFEALCSLYDKNEPVDLVLVTNLLREQGKLDAIGGVDALVGMMESVPSAAHADAYAQLVRASAERRRLVTAATEILRDAYDVRGSTLADLVEQAEQKIFAIARGRGEERTATMKELIREALERIDALQDEPGGTSKGLQTHYADLDRLLNGLAPGALYVVAGRPSMGKSTMALNLIDSVCVRDGIGAALFTLEMSKEQIAENMLCSNARIDAHRLMKGELSDDEYRKVPEAGARLSQAPLFIDDTPAISLTRLRAKARRLKAQHDIQLVVVDYLQLLTLGGNPESRQLEISRLSGALKQMARELEVPVIALSQLNRAVDARDDHRPRMSDLRESGSIEQDADVIMFLYREEYYFPDKADAKGKAQVIVAKNRSGPVGNVDLFFFPDRLRFECPTYLAAPSAPEPAGSSW